MKRHIFLRYVVVILTISRGLSAQATKAPDERIHLETIPGGTMLVRDVSGTYGQHATVFREMMSLRDRLFSSVGACFGIYPMDPDALDDMAALRWQVGTRVAPKRAGEKLASPPKPYRLAVLKESQAAVLETDVQHAGIDGLAMFRWLAEHGYAQSAPTRIEYLEHEGAPTLLPVRIVVPVLKRRSGLVLAPVSRE